jgi:cytidylate kinase
MNKESGPQIVESRLAGWWAFKEEIECLRLWLEVSVDERARRVIAREAGEHLQRKQEILAREQSDLSRFEELYGLNPSASTPYTHVLDATALNQEEVLAVVQSYLKEAKE